MRRLRWLLTPITFLRLQSPDLTLAQWTLPLVLATLITISYYALPVRPQLIGDGGAVQLINGLLSTLIGFYIAALAAIAAFPNISLDAPMKGRTPTLVFKKRGELHKETLTRRRFLVVLFGYAAFLAIFLFIIGNVSTILAPSVEALRFAEVARFLWIASYAFVASSLMVSTLLGLHYLIDRMHRD